MLEIRALSKQGRVLECHFGDILVLPIRALCERYIGWREVPMAGSSDGGKFRELPGSGVLSPRSLLYFNSICEINGHKWNCIGHERIGRWIFLMPHWREGIPSQWNYILLMRILMRKNKKRRLLVPIIHILN